MKNDFWESEDDTLLLAGWNRFDACEELEQDDEEFWMVQSYVAKAAKDCYDSE